jgi:hypothetical protein
MIYKLYIDRSKQGKKLPDNDMERVFKGFQEIYRKYGVTVIGAWENVDDTLESYLITAYQDKPHYEETIAKMRADSEYVKLSEELQGTRESVKAVTLRLLPGSFT